jgi:hypothetical protein
MHQPGGAQPQQVRYQEPGGLPHAAVPQGACSCRTLWGAVGCKEDEEHATSTLRLEPAGTRAWLSRLHLVTQMCPPPPPLPHTTVWGSPRCIRVCTTGCSLRPLLPHTTGWDSRAASACVRPGVPCAIPSREHRTRTLPSTAAFSVCVTQISSTACDREEVTCGHPKRPSTRSFAWVKGVGFQRLEIENSRGGRTLALVASVLRRLLPSSRIFRQSCCGARGPRHGRIFRTQTLSVKLMWSRYELI